MRGGVGFDPTTPSVCLQENFDLAYEHNPEAFSSVCML